MNKNKLKYARGGEVLPEYSFGGWVKENKEGLIGGAMAALGAGAMFVPGLQGVGTSLIGSGVGSIAGEITDGNSANQNQINKPIEMGSNPVANNVFPYGGMNNKSTVELETGEVFMTPIGKFGTVKKDDSISHKNGGAVMDMDIGTKILGKMKNKKTGKSFKEDAVEKITRPSSKLDELEKKSKNKYTLNAIKAMRRKLKDKFNEMYNEQEVKKSKSNDPRKFFNGGITGGPTYNELELGQKGLNPGLTRIGTDPSNMLNSQWFNTGFNSTMPSGKLDLSQLNQPVQTNQPVSTQQVNQQSTPQVGSNGLDLNSQEVGPNISPNIPTLGDAPQRQVGPIDVIHTNYAKEAFGDFGSKVGPLMQYAPIAYNLIQGLRKPERESLPDYYKQSISTLRNREFDIEPILEGNRNAQQVYDTNLNRLGAGKGSVYSGRLASSAARTRADAEAYATKNNMENQYATQLANAQMTAGGAQRGVDVANLQNEAARRAYLGESMSQLSDVSQRNQLMENMTARDRERLKVLGKWYPFFNRQFGDINFSNLG